MLRMVLAVAMGAALLAVATPAVETARVSVSDGQVAGELDRLDAAAERLARNDPPPHGTAGAKRVLTLEIPRESWSRAGVDRLTLREGADSADGEPLDGAVVARWRVAGGTERVRHLPQVASVGSDAGSGLTLGGGRQRLVLELQPDGSVLLRRPDV